MNETQAQQLVDAITRQNQLLEGIDWKLWELFKHIVPQEEEKK
jgi:hypothetical protein